MVILGAIVAGKCQARWHKLAIGGTSWSAVACWVLSVLSAYSVTPGRYDDT